MSNAKRFLSVILAIIFICSTLVVGVNAVYTPYKDAAIKDQYNALDKPVLTTEQYGSAALDEVDRMLAEEHILLGTKDIYVGELDLTSVDAALDSVVALVDGSAFRLAGGLIGDLKNLSVDALRTVRRTSANKTDLDVVYSLFQFLYDNKGLFTGYINGTLNIGSLLDGLLPAEYKDVHGLLLNMMYEEVVPKAERPSRPLTDQDTLDSLIQERATQAVVEELGDTEEIRNATNLNTGIYDFIDKALRIVYNIIGVRELNRINFINNIKELCGVVVTEELVVNPQTGETEKVYHYDYSNVNGFYNIINVQDGQEFTIPKFNFATDKIVALQVNNLLGSIVTNVVNCDVLDYTWESGENTNLLANVVNLAKAIIQYDNANDLGLFASYIHRATDAEIELMSNEELITYILRAIINGSVDGMYIPDSATTMREFGFYTLQQLLATSVPECDFTALATDGVTTDDLIVMGIDFAVYNINAELDMGLDYVYDMNGVDTQLAKAAEYGITNYGGLLNGLALNPADGGWVTLDKIIFSIFDLRWFPEDVYTQPLGSQFKTLLIDVLVDNILDLNLEGMLNLLQKNGTDECDYSVKKTVINLVSRVFNIIFPNAFQPANTIEQLAQNSALANTVNAIFTDLNTYKANLAKGILPTLCDILDLTTAHEFELPTFTYDSFMQTANGAITNNKITIRNESSGLNTGYTDANGVFHQDARYKYDIQAIETNPTSVTATAITEDILAGEEATITLGGTFQGSGVVTVTVTYDILTEDGSTLTANPIVEKLYIYMSASGSVATFETRTVGNHTAELPLYAFVRNMDELCDITEKISTSQTGTDPFAIAFSATSMAPNNFIGDYIQYKTDQTIQPAMVNDEGKVYSTQTNAEPFTTTDAYDLLPETSEDPSETTKETVWDNFIAKSIVTGRTPRQRYTLSGFNVNVGGTAITYSNTTTKFYIYPYKDYNLDKLFENECNKRRQQSDYTDASAWTAYETAMKQAAGAVYAPFTDGFDTKTTGKAALYQSASEGLTAAIEALEASRVKTGGFDGVLAAIEAVHPDNGDKEYDDEEYNYFGVSDFVSYTYYNFRKEEKAANKAYESTIDKGDGKEPKVVDSISIANYKHRVEMMGSRLLPVKATLTHLTRAIAQSTPTSAEANYTPESWAEYARARAFANSVVNEFAINEDIRQSKINTAYEQILEADKRLIASGEKPVDPQAYLPVDPDNGELPIIATTDDEGAAIKVLAGVAPGAVENYFDTSVCDIVVTRNSKGVVSTGAIVEVKDKSGKLVETYVLSYSGDINLDGACGDGFDLPVSAKISSGATVVKGATFLAGDLNNDGKSDGFDLPIFAKAASGAIVIDFYNRCAK